MDRFISFTSCLVMALFWLIENLQLSEEITVIAFFSLVAPLAFLMMIHPRVTRTFRPISIGLLSTAIGLAVAITALSWNTSGCRFGEEFIDHYCRFYRDNVSPSDDVFRFILCSFLVQWWSVRNKEESSSYFCFGLIYIV